jgi:hypothetical protein
MKKLLFLFILVAAVVTVPGCKHLGCDKDKAADHQ